MIQIHIYEDGTVVQWNAETIQKNAAIPKNHMSRVNLLNIL